MGIKDRTTISGAKSKRKFLINDNDFGTSFHLNYRTVTIIDPCDEDPLQNDLCW